MEEANANSDEGLLEEDEGLLVKEVSPPGGCLLWSWLQRQDGPSSQWPGLWLNSQESGMTDAAHFP